MTLTDRLLLWLCPWIYYIRREARLLTAMDAAREQHDLQHISDEAARRDALLNFQTGTYWQPGQPGHQFLTESFNAGQQRGREQVALRINLKEMETALLFVNRQSKNVAMKAAMRDMCQLVAMIQGTAKAREIAPATYTPYEATPLPETIQPPAGGGVAITTLPPTFEPDPVLLAEKGAR